MYDYIFSGDPTSSMRTVSHDDSVPTMLPIGDSQYQFVSTGIHVYGWSAMYGQQFTVCENWPDNPECMGGSTAADVRSLVVLGPSDRGTQNMFYFTQRGQCCQDWANNYDSSWNYGHLASLQSAYAATATGPIPNLLAAPTSASSSVVSSLNSTSAIPSASASVTFAQNAAASTDESSRASKVAVSSLSALLLAAVAAWYT
jgi:hypothetical protein